MSSRIFINGKRATRKEAQVHFVNSDTYKNARRKTRDSILSVAIDGDASGNHNPNGEVEHLIEAGIELRA